MGDTVKGCAAVMIEDGAAGPADPEGWGWKKHEDSEETESRNKYSKILKQLQIQSAQQELLIEWLLHSAQEDSVDDILEAIQMLNENNEFIQNTLIKVYRLASKSVEIADNRLR